MNKLGGVKKETQVIETLESLCVKANFGTFKYPDDAMTHGCRVFIDSYNEELEAFLVKRKTDDIKELQKQLCGGTENKDEVSVTRACYNVRDDEPA